jgi:hypothetical protein
MRMRTKLKPAPGILAGLLLVASPLLTSGATAQEQKRAITLPPGATATTLKGAIRGDASIAYSLPMAEGQTLQLLFSPSNRACYMNVIEPGAREAVHIGSTSGNEFGQNPTKAGAYTVQVYLMRSAARRGETCRYSLTVEITGKPGGISAGVSDRVMRDACRAGAASMYGVVPRRVTIGRIAPGKPIPVPGAAPLPAPAFIAEGVADKGREGRKKLRCIFTPDRTLDRIMALTPDGE